MSVNLKNIKDQVIVITGASSGIGLATAQLAADRVTLLEREPLLLKGKRERVAVFEAVAIRGRDDALTVRDAPPLVGRDDELAFLQSLWRRVRRDGRRGPAAICSETARS